MLYLVVSDIVKILLKNGENRIPGMRYHND